MAGVSRPAVSAAIKTNRLRGAIVGDLVDADHPAAKRFIEQAIAAKVRASPPRKRKSDNLGTPDPSTVATTIRDLSADVQALLDRPFREIVEIFGTAKDMVDWLKSVAIIDKIHKTRLDNSKIEGDLVSRDLVVTAVIGPINVCHKQILTSVARSLSRRVSSMALAGRSAEEIEVLIRDQLGVPIRQCKEHITEVLADDTG
jgi:hypothetical protein